MKISIFNLMKRPPDGGRMGGTMKRKMRFIFPLIMAAFLLNGCQSDDDRAETELLKQQISDLQEQLSELQQGAASGANTSTESSVPQTEETPQVTPDTQTETTPQVTPDVQTQNTDTMNELTSLVDGFVQKVDETLISSKGDPFDQFLSLKKESNEIETKIDSFEDELEKQYRDGTLSRDDYRDLDRELEALEDSIDHAEDTLENVFGMDD